jgi:hypothetical protein
MMTPTTPAPSGNTVPPKPTSVHGRVLVLVQKWAKLKTLPSDTDQLAVLWAPQAAPYNPDGAQRLAKAIKAEFSAPPVICQCITVADLTQRIKCVSDLVSAVPGCPQP